MNRLTFPDADRTIFPRSSAASRTLCLALLFVVLVSPLLSAGQSLAQPPTSNKAAIPTPEIADLLKQATTAADQKQNEEALARFQTAQERAHALGDQSGEGRALRGLGDISHDTAHPEKALEQYRKALALVRQASDRAEEAETLVRIGVVYAETGRPEQALTFYRQATSVFRLIGDEKGEARVFNNIGNVYADTGQKEKAIASYQQALRVHQKNGDTIAEARALNNMGTVYAEEGEMRKSLTLYQQALKKHQQANNPNGVAGTLNNIGATYKNMGQLRRCLPYFQQALLIHQREGDVIAQANAVENIAQTHAESGRPTKALEFHQRALALYRRAGNAYGEAHTLTDIGLVYMDIGQPQKALAFFEQALPVCRQSGDKNGEGKAISDIGLVYLNGGQLARALGRFQEARDLFQRSGDGNDVATTMAAIGIVYWRQGALSRAKDYLQRALQAHRQIEDDYGVANASAALAAVYEDEGKQRTALTLLRQTLSAFQRAGYRGEEATTLMRVGALYARSGQRRTALSFYRRGIGVIEDLRTELETDPESRNAFLQNRLDIYYLAIDALLMEDTPAARREAFLLTQKMKARTLLDRLAGARTDLQGRLTPQEQDREAELRAECDRLNRLMIAEGVRNEIGSKKRFLQYRAQLKKAEQTFSTYRDSLYARYPDLSAKRVARTETLESIARALPPDTALLEFVTLKVSPEIHGQNIDRTALFVVTASKSKADLQVIAIPMSAKDLAREARDLHDACARPGGNVDVSARRLSRTLLGGVLPQIARKRSLIVCPDGPLWQAPFAVLPGKNGRILLDDYDMTLAYSATGWKAALTVRQVQQRRTGKTRQANTMLALADPDFGTVEQLAGAADFGNTPGVPGQRPISLPDRPVNIPDRPISLPDRALALALPAGINRGRLLRPLPGTRQEASAIVRFFPHAKVLTGRDAQEAVFKKLAPSYPLLHLATHAFFNDASPLLSSLVLAAPPVSGPGSQEDGLLTARELLDLDLSGCELAVLSACNTGVGEQRSGEGIVGLTWSLLAAGCPSQVVSGWPVSDQSTAQLMAGFYAHFKQGKSKAQALRQASLALRRSPATRHPYYWAPFFLVGIAQ